MTKWSLLKVHSFVVFLGGGRGIKALPDDKGSHIAGVRSCFWYWISTHYSLHPLVISHLHIHMYLSHLGETLLFRESAGLLHALASDRAEVRVFLDSHLYHNTTANKNNDNFLSSSKWDEWSPVWQHFTETIVLIASFSNMQFIHIEHTTCITSNLTKHYLLRSCN